MEQDPAIAHEPVLLNAVVEQLSARGPGTYLDATFGDGGHSIGLLEADSRNRVIALDCDPEAVARGQEHCRRYGERLRLLHLNFEELGTLGLEELSGVLFDFGVSSHHLDDARRGFSFRKDGPLDMRLNAAAGEPASRFLQRATRAQLIEAVRTFGEEPRWRRVVESIEAARGTARLSSTLGLAELVAEATGGRRPGERIHPATRTFQGIRIAVNRELQVIEAALPQAFACLRVGGRMAAISFHSLEDRIVKRFMRRMAGKAEHERDGVPEQMRERWAVQITTRPVVADAAECARNPRARSAKLRILEKLREAA